MKTTSGGVVTGHSGQVTASSMGTRGGIKSCTLDRSRLELHTGQSHDGPRKMVRLDDGGNTTCLHRSPAILVHASVPGLWMFSGSAECSPWRLFKLSVCTVPECLRTKYRTQRNPFSMTIPSPQVYCPPGTAWPVSSSTPRDWNHLQETCVRLAYELSIMQGGKVHEAQTVPEDM